MITGFADDTREDKSNGTYYEGSISGKLIIPKSIGGVPVTDIGDYAFSGCSSLTSVTIGNSVELIDDGAFNGCSKLSRVYYRGTEEEWNAITIYAYNEPLTNASKAYNYTGE